MENPDDAMIRQGMRRARNLRRIFWVGCLWMAAWVTICLEQAITNTDLVTALKYGVVVGAFVSPFMLIILVPLGLIGRDLGNWKPLRPYRWWISLALPIGACLIPVVSSIRDRIDPGRSFERYLHASLPKNARHVRTEIWRLIISDPYAIYVFECPKEETEQLLRDLNLKSPDEYRGPAHAGTGRGLSTVVSGWVNPKEWRDLSDKRKFITVWTDETRTKVCVHYQRI